MIALVTVRDMMFLLKKGIRSVFKHFGNFKGSIQGIYFIAGFLMRSIIKTWLFNDYNDIKSRNPHRTHKTPPQD